MTRARARLTDSPFLAGLDSRDRSLWRIVATVAGGLAGGVAVGLFVGGLALLVCALVLAPAVGGLRGGVGALMSGDGPPLAIALGAMAVAVSTNLPLALVFVLIAAAIGRRRMSVYFTAAPRFRWRLLLSGLLLSFVVIGPMVVVGQLLDPHAPRPPLLSLSPAPLGRTGYALASFLLLIPAAAAEEMVFRGWLLRQTAAFVRNPAVLLVLNGVIFSAVHVDFAPDAFLTRALMGAGFAYMTLRLGGIEFSTGAHAANNILIVLLIQPLSLTPTPSGGFTLDSLLEDVFLAVAYVAMTEITARWPPLRRWSGADAGASSPSQAGPATIWSGS